MALAQTSIIGGGNLKRVGLWVALLILTAWSIWQFSKPVNTPQPSLKALDVGRVFTLTLTSESRGVVRLEKQKKEWMLAGKLSVPANGEFVQHLLSDLAGMRIIRVVAYTRAHDSALGMNKGTRITLLNDAGASVLTLTIGKQGSDLISTYVRVESSPEVLAVDKALVWQVGRDSNAWKAPLANAVGHKNSRAKNNAS